MNLENETIDIKHSVLRSIFEPIGPFPFYGISVHGSLDSTSFPEGFIHARKFLKFIPQHFFDGRPHSFSFYLRSSLRLFVI